MVARRLSIDFAPALTGWTERGGRSLPVFDGIVVCAEQAQGLRAAAATRLSDLLAGKEAGAVGSSQLLRSDSDPEDIDQETHEESDDGQDASSDMGNYERARAEHIARNHDVLAQLGLGASGACGASSAPPAHFPQGAPSGLDLACSPHTEWVHPHHLHVANDAGAFAESPPPTLSHNQTYTPAGQCKSEEVEVMDDKQMKEVLKAWATVSLRLLTWFASAPRLCNLTAGCHSAEHAGEGAEDTGGTSLEVVSREVVSLEVVSLEPRHPPLEKAISIARILRQLCVLVGAPVVLHKLMHEHANHTLQIAKQEGMASGEDSDCFATLPHVSDRSTVHLLTSCTREQGCTCQAVSTGKASFKQVSCPLRLSPLWWCVRGSMMLVCARLDDVGVCAAR